MAPERIAILEDDERRTDAMKRALTRSLPPVEAVFFDNAPDMIAWLRPHLPGIALTSLDYDLGPTRMRDLQPFHPGDGRDVADALAAHAPSCPVILHTSNPVGRDGMLLALQSAGWTVECVGPFDDLEWVQAAWIPSIRALLGR